MDLKDILGQAKDLATVINVAMVVLNVLVFGIMAKGLSWFKNSLTQSYERSDADLEVKIMQEITNLREDMRMDMDAIASNRDPVCNLHDRRITDIEARFESTIHSIDKQMAMVFDQVKTLALNTETRLAQIQTSILDIAKK